MFAESSIAAIVKEYGFTPGIPPCVWPVKTLELNSIVLPISLVKSNKVLLLPP